MRFEEPLLRGELIRRYKRFLADIRLADDQWITAHCANTGAMLGCNQPGSTVFVSKSSSKTRKLPYSLELVESTSGDVVCVNTARANQLVGAALAERKIKELAECGPWKSEIKIPGGGGRFDFGYADYFVEVKSVTYLDDGIGKFPDARSERATKHVNELANLATQKKHAVLLFCVLHNGVSQVSIADHIDPVYHAAVLNALEVGVEVLAYRWDLTPSEFALAERVPFRL